ncbi:MAG: calcium/sodium antiporter [Bacillota bacterium]|nr:calcium/sodium antiporter [Bacillota bacterium]
METFLMYALFILGILFIVKGGDFFVEAATWIAEVSGIPHFVVGATIVSLATTLPEIIVSVIAASHGNVPMATGNAVGSVTANTGLIMGLSLLMLPTVISRKKFMPKATMLIAAVAILWLCSLGGDLTIYGCIAMFIIFAVFLYENIREAKIEMKSQNEKEDKPSHDKTTIIKNISLFILGAAAIVIGSQLLVDKGSEIALSFHIDPRIISITAIAIGTSLPELVTTITAISKKQSSLSVGNIIGANIIDTTLILPLCSLITGGSLPVSKGTVCVDMPVCLIIILVTLIPTLITKKLSRWQGISALVIYLSYIIYICVFSVF